MGLVVLTMTHEAGTEKKAGALVYLQEELTDARLRCDQLKKFVGLAIKHISGSKHRDVFYEMAGDLVYGIPDALFRLDKALSAAALATSRMDYEELKQQLKPEKVQELEQVLKGVRIRQLDRLAPDQQPVQEKSAMYKAASTERIVSALQRIASEVSAASISPKEATLRVHRVLMALAQTPEEALQAVRPFQASSPSEVIDLLASANPSLTTDQLTEVALKWAEEEDEKLSKFEEGKPADPTENMSEEDAKKWRLEHLNNKDNFTGEK